MGRMSVIKLPQTGFTLSENVVKRVCAGVCMFVHVFLNRNSNIVKISCMGNEGRHKLHLSHRSSELLCKYPLNQLSVNGCA